MRFLLSFAALLLVVGEARSAQVFENEKVMVTEERIEPGATLAEPGNRPSVVIYLDDGSLEIQPKAGEVRTMAVKRGQTVYQPPEARTAKNAGSSELRFVRILFRSPGLDETWGAAGLSPNYKLLFEHRYDRTYEIKIAPGGSEPQHTHKDRVLVCLSGSRVMHMFPDGSKETAGMKTGEIAWREGGTHVGRNIGDTTLWVIAIEPK
jgi:quercetin dioxygenase-like cupin family protein